jgi:ELP3 family radical SAM enzyme/protein acetyltransferase
MSDSIARHFIREFLKWNPIIDNKDELANATIYCRKKYKATPTKMQLLQAYNEVISLELHLPKNKFLQRLLVRKAVRSDSGILNISVSLPPYEKGFTGPFTEKTSLFSCKYNCYFCPNEPGMPRSYLSNEDVFTRAADVNFDTVKQVHNRLKVLQKNGHPIDKLEYRILGGSYSCYEHSVTDEFIRDLYYAANIYYDIEFRAPLSIEEEQVLNVNSRIHVVGIGVETRPDEINNNEIIRFRRYGITRVELGIQHTDDSLLKIVNRGHGIKHSKKAIKLLKDYGFKLELHIMTDLPGTTPEKDKECYTKVLQSDPDLIPDYMKDYPCLDVSFTKIKEWKQTGKWQPYAEKNDGKDLIDVLVYRQKITPKWVRVNRIQRDFRQVKDLPGHHIGFTSDTVKSNLAQIVKIEAEKQGIYCQCIRCREVRDEKFKIEEIVYNVVKFPASDGIEYFISAEVESINKILGFLRLRISSALQSSIIPELKGDTAMIRELHVYGKVNEVGTKEKSSAQHLGIGKKLLKIAEDISVKHSFNKVAVISGIGVRDYYKKRGYNLEGTYMIKNIKSSEYRNYLLMIILLLASVLVSMFLI